MTDIAHSIDLNLPQKLRNLEYRRKFFWAESSARIAAQLIDLRKRRGLNQKQVAEIMGTKQPAISRVEQADYQNWNLNTLRSIADALDARVRVLIQPSEDILKEYDGEATEAEEVAGNDVTGAVITTGAVSVQALTGAALAQFASTNQLPSMTWPWNITQFPGMGPVIYGNLFLDANWLTQPTGNLVPTGNSAKIISELKQALAEKETANANLRAENERLKNAWLARAPHETTSQESSPFPPGPSGPQANSQRFAI